MPGDNNVDPCQDSAVDDLFKEDDEFDSEPVVVAGGKVITNKEEEKLKDSNIVKREKLEKVEHVYNKIMLNFTIEVGKTSIGPPSEVEKFKGNFSHALMKVLDEEVEA